MSFPKRDKTPLKLTDDCDFPILFAQYLSDEVNYARSLETGLKQGKDPEYNHQYRVALRRTRSLLLLLEDALPPFEVRLLKKQLKVLMKQTNQLRDLDVFLLERPKYLQMAPQPPQAIADLFRLLSEQQRNEHQRVTHWLESRHYTGVCMSVENSLKRSFASDHELSEASSATFARKNIAEHLAQVVTQCRQLNKDSPDDAIHALRIECKKLRYLLEFYSGVFTDQVHRLHISQLKILQDKLGVFNDTSTQIAFFEQQLQQKQLPSPIRKAIKSLLKTTQHQHQDARVAIIKQLKRYQQDIENEALQSFYAAG
ncbi:CHAD domain-containing protein [Vibrio sp. CAU 1672]|uniref:CHAD domain-containing protein n=1 Tax=Vibrio sp. CAU 1672 TaxID=3032594 RepID=UPI0023D9ECB0|nr:CHAD domain-containing protein [Vibrio sp. CAU 1672]MDF2153424.1 CHAD domain-containing protein [Vibrio sp. CAU 1672]